MIQRVEFIESYIKIGNGDYQWNDNHGELIRCKDCKWYDEQISLCDNCRLPRERTFFCADGERKPTQTNAKNNALDVR